MPLLVDILLALAAAALTVVAARAIPRERRAPGSMALEAAEAAGEAGGTEARRHPWLGRRLAGTRLDPTTTAGLALVTGLLLAVIGWVVVAILALLVRTVDAVQRVDDAAAEWGHDHTSTLSSDGLHAITFLGETTTAIGVAVAVAIVELVRSRRPAVIGFLVAVIAGQGLLTVAVKNLADRVRPAIEPVAATLGPSFPSGHSATAAATYAAAALVLGRTLPRPGRVAFAAAAVGIGVAVAASRVLLDLHWASDVVGGLALGWGWFATCALVFGGRLLRPAVTAAAGTSAARSEAAPSPPDGRERA